MQSSRRRQTFVLILMTMSLTGACSARESVGSATDPFVQPTVAAQSESIQPSAEVQISCANDMIFIEDLTFQDGAIVEPGATLDKRWSVRNSGTCDWGSDYRLIRLDAGGLASPSQVALYPARSGQSGILRVVFTAPTEPGSYQSRWQSTDPQGSPFGVEIFVLVEVLASDERPAIVETPEA